MPHCVHQLVANSLSVVWCLAGTVQWLHPKFFTEHQEGTKTVKLEVENQISELKLGTKPCSAEGSCSQAISFCGFVHV